MDQEIHEERVFARTLTTDSKGESICNFMRDYCMKEAVLFLFLRQFLEILNYILLSRN